MTNIGIKYVTRAWLVNELIEMWIDAHCPNHVSLKQLVREGYPLPGFDNETNDSLKETYENITDQEIVVVEHYEHNAKQNTQEANQLLGRLATI